MYVVCTTANYLTRTMSNKWCLINSDILNIFGRKYESCVGHFKYMWYVLPGSPHILAINYSFLRRLLILVGKTVQILFDIYEKYFKRTSAHKSPAATLLGSIYNKKVFFVLFWLILKKNIFNKWDLCQ